MNTSTTSELRLALTNELLRICPAISKKRAINHINSYVNEVLGEITCGMQFDDIDSEFQFRLKKVQLALKQIKINGNRAWMFTYFSNYEALRLVTTVMKGHTGRNSKVILSDRYAHMIIDELSDYLSNLYKPTTPASIKSNITNANIFIPIDVDSLNAFITKCGDTAKQTADGRYKQKIIENKKAALDTLSLAVERDGHHCLPEVHEETDCGRSYGKGISLQTQRKEVRNAALGVCHQYDFQAHSFAVMTSLAKAIAEDSGQHIYTASLESYINNRTAIRQKIAADIGVSEDRIKMVFTALGFGAKTVNNTHNAIRKALTQDQYDALMSHSTFRYIDEELKAVNDLIDRKFSSKGFEWYGRTYIPTKDGKKRNKAQKLAWIYQCCETEITRLFIGSVRSQTGMEPLLVVHDAIYYKQRIPTEALVDAQLVARSEFQLVRIEHKEIVPITTDAHFRSRYAEANADEAEHKGRIIAETERARQIYGDG